MKVITTLTLTVLISITALNNSYASLQDCSEAAKNIGKHNFQKAIKYCLPYKKDVGAAAILAGAYYFDEKYSLAIKYGEYVINQSKTEKVDQLMLAADYASLGNLYYFGKGVSKDVQKGLQYITKGAELGNATAQSQLGSFYGEKNSKDVNKNFVMNYYWTTLAVLNGNSEANKFNFVKQHYDQFKKQYPYCIALGQDNVGQAYYEGIGGLEQSTAKALDWLEKAASTDPNVSQVNLDLAKLYYLNGDKDKAFTTAQKAATQPLAQAMQYLGTLYQKGVGTDKNPVKAYAYLSLAVELYNNPATQFWQKYAAPCRPNYEGRTKEFNVKVATEQLSEIDLSAKQKQQAEQIIKQVKGKFKQ